MLPSCNVSSLVHVALILAIGVPVLWLLSRWVTSVLRGRVAPHVVMVTRNIIFYIGLSTIIISILKQFGFELSGLLGAAGVIGIAVGFAAQTSISNIISGIFILVEDLFEVGNDISCGGVTGKVESIDLFSIKLRTSDNRLVRVPNEFLLKNVAINYSYFDHRRLDMKVSFAAGYDVNDAIKTLNEVIKECQYALPDPDPVIKIQSATLDSFNVVVQIWVARKDVAFFYTFLIPEIKKHFDAKEVRVGVTSLSETTVD